MPRISFQLHDSRIYAGHTHIPTGSQTPILPPRTAAQQILESAQEAKEADELLSSLHNWVISPTPTRDTFPRALEPPRLRPPQEFKLDLDFGIKTRCGCTGWASKHTHRRWDSLSSTTSRSSTPDSLFSLESSSSTLSSRSTRTSRKTPELERMGSLPMHNAATQSDHPSDKSTSSRNTPRSPHPPVLGSIAPVRQKQRRTRYRYNGGMSVVLTGGVMLGGRKTRSGRRRRG